MAEGKIPMTNLITENFVIETYNSDGTTQNRTIRKNGNIVSFYWSITNMSTSHTSLNIILNGALPVSLRPIEQYAVFPIFTNASPYAPVGTIWFNNIGGAVIYKPLASDYVYAYGMYIAQDS